MRSVRAQATLGLVRPKEYRFPVEVEWRAERTVAAHVRGKRELAVATPPEFHADADPAVWSPEDLFGAAAATCLAVTIAGLAEREGLPLHDLTVSAEGIVGRRADGAFGFVRLEQRVELATDHADEERARALVERAEAGCLVAASLDVEIATEVEIRLALGGLAGARLGDA
jgi:organic hydroperoxide reductase OsmC/OhrA